MREFLLASSNAHKAEEFSVLFQGALSVLAAPEAIEVDETGMTFVENALLKAKAYYDRFQKPTLADDSGLTIEELTGILGVQSARFLPAKPDYEDKCAELLRLLEGFSTERRKAFFSCTLCFYLSPSEIYFFEGKLLGQIGNQYVGEHGFGYDPIFIPEAGADRKTLAQLPEWKNQQSHRARAAQAAMAFWKSYKD